MSALLDMVPCVGKTKATQQSLGIKMNEAQLEEMLVEASKVIESSETKQDSIKLKKTVSTLKLIKIADISEQVLEKLDAEKAIKKLYFGLSTADDNPEKVMHSQIRVICK